jgi:hypothetical protein
VLDTENLNTTRALLESGLVGRVTAVQEDLRVAAEMRANAALWGVDDRLTVVDGDMFDYIQTPAAACANYGLAYIDAEGYGGDMAGRYDPAKSERSGRRYVGDAIAAFVTNCPVRCFAFTSTLRGKNQTRVQRVGDMRRCLGARLPAHEYAVGYQAAEGRSQYMALDIYTCRPAGTPTVYRTKMQPTAVNPRDGHTYVQRVGYGQSDRNRVRKPEYVMRVPPGARVGKYVAHAAGDVFAQCINIK